MKLTVDKFADGFVWWLTTATGLVLEQGYDNNLDEAKRQAGIAVEKHRGIIRDDEELRLFEQGEVVDRVRR